MLSSGISFKRLFVPYMVSAAIIAALNLYLSCYVIPPANVTRIEYMNTYVKNKRVDYASNIQLQVEPGVIAYISRYDNSNKTGYRFSLEKFDKKVLQSRLTAQTIHYDSAYHWRVNNYVIRNFNGMREELIKGSTLDTIVPIEPSDFLISQNDSEVMTTPELRRYIIRQKERGVANIKNFEIEYERQFRYGCRGIYLDSYRYVVVFPEGKRGYGYQYRYRFAVKFLIYIILDCDLYLCGIGGYFTYVGDVDTQYHLYGNSDRAI